MNYNGNQPQKQNIIERNIKIKRKKQKSWECFLGFTKGFLNGV